MPWCGGKRGSIPILGSREWLWTTYLFRVRGAMAICCVVCTDSIIPATSVEVERVFSRGRILISHLRNRLSSQTTRALMCLNYWSHAGLVHDKDVLKVTRTTEIVEGDVDIDLEDGWDSIDLNVGF